MYVFWKKKKERRNYCKNRMKFEMKFFIQSVNEEKKEKWSTVSVPIR